MPLRRSLASGACVLLATGFVALAIHRRLNFDEALALRAGWLELAGIEAEPAFVMPWTLAVGALGHAVDDPGAVFLAARLLAVLGVLAASGFALSRSGLVGSRRPLAGLLLLAQGSFVTHGLEFRYDAAILMALLVLYGAVAPDGAERPALAGVALALLSLHHLKGLVFALALAVWCVPRLARRPGGPVRAALAAGATLAAWIVGLALGGLEGRWLATLGGFWALARDVTRVAADAALGPAMLRDLAWWLLATAGLVAALVARRRGGGGAPEGAAIVFAAVALGFVVVHPHPWAYMLALPAPFLAAIVAGRWPERGLRSGAGRAWVAAVGGALVLQSVLGLGTPLAAWRAAREAPRAPEVAALRAMRAVAAPGDRVLDPSGLAYFLVPCTRQWYLDTLFAEAVRRGAWMEELVPGVPADCRWSLATYRLAAIPAAARADLARDFVRFPSSVAARATRLSAQEHDILNAVPATRITNFW